MTIKNLKFRCFLLFFFTLALSFNLYADNVGEKTTFLAISDLHFDPFYSCDETKLSCPILEKLQQQPASNWEEIFDQYDHEPPNYAKETNHILFKQSLSKFKNIIDTNQIAFVVLAGDFLEHGLKNFYFKYDPNADDAAYEIFITKLYAYLTMSFKKTIGTINTYMVIGNNDSFDKHYTSSPKFYQAMYPIWSDLIIDHDKQQKMKKGFSQHGYYSIDEATNKNLKLIFLNSVYFSTQFTYPSDAAANQLTWLDQTLADAAENQQKVLIITHIPIGIDAYSTIEKGQTVPFLHPTYIEKMDTLLKKYHSTIIAILSSHTHADWFQNLSIDDTQLVMSSIPAISPQFGNNPAFKVFKINTKLSQLEDYQVYFYRLDRPKPTWDLEYNFSEIYPSNSVNQGVNLIVKNGAYANAYKKYYAISRNAQPITKGKWVPYYWCAIFHMKPQDYDDCLKQAINLSTSHS